MNKREIIFISALVALLALLITCYCIPNKIVNLEDYDSVCAKIKGDGNTYAFLTENKGNYITVDNSGMSVLVSGKMYVYLNKIVIEYKCVPITSWREGITDTKEIYRYEYERSGVYYALKKITD